MIRLDENDLDCIISELHHPWSNSVLSQ